MRSVNQTASVADRAARDADAASAIIRLSPDDTVLYTSDWHSPRVGRKRPSTIFIENFNLPGGPPSWRCSYRPPAARSPALVSGVSDLHSGLRLARHRLAGRLRIAIILAPSPGLTVVAIPLIMVARESGSPTPRNTAAVVQLPARLQGGNSFLATPQRAFRRSNEYVMVRQMIRALPRLAALDRRRWSIILSPWTPSSAAAD